jgi:hypothetical protein
VDTAIAYICGSRKEVPSNSPLVLVIFPSELLLKEQWARFNRVAMRSACPPALLGSRISCHLDVAMRTFIRQETTEHQRTATMSSTDALLHLRRNLYATRPNDNLDVSTTKFPKPITLATIHSLRDSAGPDLNAFLSQLFIVVIDEAVSLEPFSFTPHLVLHSGPINVLGSVHPKVSPRAGGSAASHPKKGADLSVECHAHGQGSGRL